MNFYSLSLRAASATVLRPEIYVHTLTKMLWTLSSFIELSLQEAR